MGKALIVVDLQFDFLPPNGSLAVPTGDQIVSPIAELIKDERWSVVIATQDWHPKDHVSFAANHNLPDFSEFEYTSPAKPYGTQKATLWPVHCVQGTQGAELAPEMATAFEKLECDHHVVQKGFLADREYYSAFNDIWNDHHTQLDAMLQKHGINDVFVVGLALDYCVKSTAISAANLGYRTTILQNYTRPIASDHKAMCNLRQELIQNDVTLK
ncbi:LANO_0F05028g1_1 [Lachancea nothofagi CBS 11611]|uniref:nicotinamidase n=1 Tax=Lachancea nothofagi CBS 11611 TaxID=1266666 RepID=A0A1G4K7V4_9SACH|nr:LANO_0F05028g1_1 [Lachancea nothofagi CBS 11611]